MFSKIFSGGLLMKKKNLICVISAICSVIAACAIIYAFRDEIREFLEKLCTKATALKEIALCKIGAHDSDSDSNGDDFEDDFDDDGDDDIEVEITFAKDNKADEPAETPAENADDVEEK